ncbi:LysE family translocator [bacterium]|nr:MAG: LysE family translocator [bacterium]
METAILLKGLIAGITIAIPVGPVNLICIQRTINDGHARGLVSGLGAALADTLYGFIAGFGLTLVSQFLFENLPVLKIAGGLVIIALALRVLSAKPKIIRKNQEISTKSLWSAFTSTFAITLTNPLTIMAFIGIFAGLGLDNHSTNSNSSLILIAGVFSGSLLWWVSLSTFVDRIRHKLSPRMIHYFNRASGVIILLFGIGLIITTALEFTHSV